jgi:hypothetical protein
MAKVVADANLFLVRTRQLWKYNLFARILPVCALAVLIVSSMVGLGGRLALVLLGATVVSAASALMAILSIRCPRCGTGIVLETVIERGPLTVVSGLRTLTACPACTDRALREATDAHTTPSWIRT